MRAIHFNGEQASYTTQHPKPKPKPGEALIRVGLAALCNTDREIMAGYSPGFNNVMGHEFVGIVEEIASPFPSSSSTKYGSSNSSSESENEACKDSYSELIGSRVVGEINLSCHRPDCPLCSIRRYSQCPERKVLGIHDHDGCFADYITLPANLLHLVPDSLSDEAAIYAEPLAAALRITESSHISPNQPTALIGDGRLAFMIGQTLSLTGAPVTVFGRFAEKLELFKPFTVATRLIKGDTESLDEKDIQAFENVVDATGHPSGLATALALTRSGGMLIMKSTYASSVEINMSEVVVREITIRGSRCGPFGPALRYLDRGLVNLPPAEVFCPADYQAAFQSDAFKVVLDFRN